MNHVERCPGSPVLGTERNAPNEQQEEYRIPLTWHVERELNPSEFYNVRPFCWPTIRMVFQTKSTLPPLHTPCEPHPADDRWTNIRLSVFARLVTSSCDSIFLASLSNSRKQHGAAGLEFISVWIMTTSSFLDDSVLPTFNQVSVSSPLCSFSVSEPLSSRCSSRLGSRATGGRSSARCSLRRHDHAHPVADDGLDGSPRVLDSRALANELPVDDARHSGDCLTSVCRRYVSHSNKVCKEDGGQEGSLEAAQGISRIRGGGTINSRNGPQDDPTEDGEFSLRDESHGGIIVCLCPCSELLSKVGQGGSGSGRRSGAGAASSSRLCWRLPEIRSAHKVGIRVGALTLRSWG